MKKALALLTLLLASLPAYAQGGFIHDIVLQRRVLTNPSITYAQPVAGALIRVCTGTGTPCGPLASIFNDAALTSPKANPTSTDVNGNFKFWVLPGAYVIGITVNGVTTNFEYTSDYTNPTSLVNSLGSMNQVIFNNGTTVGGSSGMTYNDTTKTFTIDRTGGGRISLVAAMAGGQLLFGSGTTPYIQDVTAWQFAAKTGQNTAFGTAAELNNLVLLGASLGTATLGRGSGKGIIGLNDGTGGAGVFQGPSIINGVGAPEAAVTARVGSIYMRTDGGAGTTFCVKESGTGNTGWVCK